jgi:hypothetical protein
MFVISLIETNGAGAACSKHKPFTKHKRVQQLKTFRRVKRGYLSLLAASYLEQMNKR